MKLSWVEPNLRPFDGQHVAYRFEPFKGYYCGIYDSETDSASGSSGFTSWAPEVTEWYGLPDRSEP
jgi:hypothetical protein